MELAVALYDVARVKLNWRNSPGVRAVAGCAGWKTVGAGAHVRTQEQLWAGCEER